MRIRTRRIAVRLTEAEYSRFVKKVTRTGLSREAFLRHLINEYHPKESPPPEYYLMMKELRCIGECMTEIARIVYETGVLDAEAYEKNAELYRKAVREITKAVVGPDRSGA